MRASASRYMRVLNKHQDFDYRQASEHCIPHPLGKLRSRSLPGPSLTKLATLNQLVALSPFSFLGPPLTPRAYRTISRPVDVGVSSGWSARRPMSCIRASEWAGEVEKARAPLRTRGAERAANIVMDVDVYKRCRPKLSSSQAWEDATADVTAKRQSTKRRPS
jgi:hypothetical protein